MSSSWLFIGLFTAVSLVLPAVAIFIASRLAPRKPNKIKLQTYECGIETVGPAWVQVKAQYYVFALAFLVFDIEAVFLFPWAVAYNKLALFGVIEAILFILILLGGLFYIWKKGYLEWA
jgi:NADH:ubiquinone oxidoreductase subunit 3 (subunit A)